MLNAINYTLERNNFIDFYSIFCDRLKLLIGNSCNIFISAEIEFYLIKVDELKYDINADTFQSDVKNYQALSIDSHIVAKFYQSLDIKMKEHNIMIHPIEKENGKNQFEISFEKFEHPIHLADSIVIFMKYASVIADELGLHFINHGKPFKNDVGNGMHINFSIYKDEINIYRDDDNAILLYSIGGLLKKAKHIMNVSNITDYHGKDRHKKPSLNDINIYSPVNLSWGYNNRTCLVRVINDSSINTRLEFRLPSPRYNPYILLQEFLNAILYGIGGNIAPGAGLYGNAFDAQYINIEGI